MNQNELYEALRARGRQLSRTIHEYLDPQRDNVDIAKAEELLATLRVMNRVGIELSAARSCVAQKEKP